jgi:hypothetical protein
MAPPDGNPPDAIPAPKTCDPTRARLSYVAP